MRKYHYFIFILLLLPGLATAKGLADAPARGTIEDTDLMRITNPGVTCASPTGFCGPSGTDHKATVSAVRDAIAPIIPGTDPARAAESEAVVSVKQAGIPGMMGLFEAAADETQSLWFFGPADITGTNNIAWRFPGDLPEAGETSLVIGAPADEDVDGTTYTVIPVSYGTGGSGSSDPDDLNGDTVDNDLVDAAIIDPAIARDSELQVVTDSVTALQALVSSLQAAVDASGIKIFTMGITAPAAGSWHSTIPDITGTASVSGGNTITGVEWKTTGAYSGTGLTADDAAFDSASEPWTLTGLSLSEGANAITIQGVSGGDRSGEKTLTINFDSVDPVVNLGANGITDGSGETKAFTLAETNLASFTLQVDSENPVNCDLGSPTCSVTLPADTGNHTITGTATDYAGNTGSDSVLLTYSAPGACAPPTLLNIAGTSFSLLSGGCTTGVVTSMTPDATHPATIETVGGATAIACFDTNTGQADYRHAEVDISDIDISAGVAVTFDGYFTTGGTSIAPLSISTSDGSNAILMRMADSSLPTRSYLRYSSGGVAVATAIPASQDIIVNTWYKIRMEIRPDTVGNDMYYSISDDSGTLITELYADKDFAAFTDQVGLKLQLGSGDGTYGGTAFKNIVLSSTLDKI